MSGKRRKTQQLQLAFSADSRGEAPTAVGGGTEPLATRRDPESQASADAITSRTAVYGPVRTVV